MVSGLGINHHKSKIIGINVSDKFLDIASNFLSCRREENHFTFLGIPIGKNPRCMSSWNNVLNKIKPRLLNWKVRSLSFGCRLTLLKPVLCSLSIFMLSFYKAPLKVVKEITRWRILGGSEALWYKVLKARYGDINLHVITNGGNSKGASNSLWWKDIMSFEKIYNVDIFANNCSFKIGNGFTSSFWHTNSKEDKCIKELFLVVYNLSNLKHVAVAGMDGWVNGLWEWGISVMQRLIDWRMFRLRFSI
ncbi:uncharacterized protein LOC131624524 [Vicia villosa]|uniref:uncharacterized protein LOC131624524 n=1 Tax=Vicia villosa TaxID=3911 RepID=UPI00273B8B49|nr:uncharacterized protein LOC131624524 [Vicia villosa]